MYTRTRISAALITLLLLVPTITACGETTPSTAVDTGAVSETARLPQFLVFYLICQLFIFTRGIINNGFYS